jgi:hypothetical protein
MPSFLSSASNWPTWPSCSTHAVGIESQASLALTFLLEVREDSGKVASASPPSSAGRRHQARHRQQRHRCPRRHDADIAGRGGRHHRQGGLRICRKAVQHAARAELCFEGRALRMVDVLRLLLGVEVVEIAIPLIKPVNRRQHVVAVAEVVLAELAGLHSRAA